MELQNRRQHPRLWTLRIGAATLALVAAFALQSTAQAQVTFASSSNDAALTYSADVASIIQENCTVCHRAGGIGPMELVTYEDVRMYAPLIKIKVENRVMPPYYYDNDVGIQDLKEDWRLSDEDISTLVSWVDQGTPLGNADEIPELNLLDTDDWSLSNLFGPPDLLAHSTPIDVPAPGNDMWHSPIVEIQGLPEGEERCIKALQVKPRGVAKTVVHHAPTRPSSSCRKTAPSSAQSTGPPSTPWASWVRSFPRAFAGCCPQIRISAGASICIPGGSERLQRRT